MHTGKFTAEEQLRNPVGSIVNIPHLVQRFESSIRAQLRINPTVRCRRIYGRYVFDGLLIQQHLRILGYLVRWGMENGGR